MLLGAFLVPTVHPALRLGDTVVQARLGVPFERALDNLLGINTVAYDPKVYNRTGLLTGGRFVRAGGGYGQPWTRDAAINSWNAASLFEPLVARDTLWSVTVPSPDGPVVQRDNQWWDKAVWIVGAWSHFRVTGDRAFLATAYGVASRLLREQRAERYGAGFGLFRGPSFFNDGIAGYPSPPASADDSGSSFVLDHPGTDRIMALSTNCLYVGAYRATAAMADELGQPGAEWAHDADDLKRTIARRFWMPERRTYGYLLFPDGRLDPSQEGCGLAFSVLFDVASPARAQLVLRNAHREPFGIDDVWPPFPRFSDARPGRHNNVVWPMVQGMWARAAARARDAETLGWCLENVARLAKDGRFGEIHNARTGEPDGGWQNGRHWDSAPDQTWSATAYLGMVTDGLFGFRFEPKGLRFEPLVPKGWDGATLTDVPYRGATLDIRIRGTGSKARMVRLDGKLVRLVPGDLSGRHTVEIDVR